MTAFRHQVKTLAPLRRYCATYCPRTATALVTWQNPLAEGLRSRAGRTRSASSRRWKAGSCRSPESLAAYKRGAELLAFCQAALKDAQLQVEILEKGVLKPFAPDGGDDGS